MSTREVSVPFCIYGCVDVTIDVNDESDDSSDVRAGEALSQFINGNPVREDCYIRLRDFERF